MLLVAMPGGAVVATSSKLSCTKRTPSHGDRPLRVIVTSSKNAPSSDARRP